MFFVLIEIMVFGGVAAIVRSRLAATGLWVGTLAMSGISIATSFSPKTYTPMPYRPGDGIPSTR
jgi:hypothetical protein